MAQTACSNGHLVHRPGMLADWLLWMPHTQDLDDDEAVSAFIAAGALLAAKDVCEQAPRAHVVLLAVTPRGDRSVDWPARHMFSQPCKCAGRPPNLKTLNTPPGVICPALSLAPDCGPAGRHAMRRQKRQLAGPPHVLAALKDAAQ